MLAGKGDTDNSDEENDAEENMNDRCVESSANQPEILANKERQPVFFVSLATCLPNGHNTNPAILKHCRLQGMQHKPELQQKYPIARLGVFGSYARAEAT